jgi:NDP-sugar pyrophosphorylase family protein
MPGMIATLLPKPTGAGGVARKAPPVSLLPVADDTLITHQLRALRRAGFGELIISSQCPALREYFQTHQSEGMDISFETCLPAEPILMLASDALPGEGLRALIDSHLRRQWDVTAAVTARRRRALGIYVVSPGSAEHADPSLLCNTTTGTADRGARTFVLADDSIRIQTVDDYLAATGVLLGGLRGEGGGLRRIGDDVWAAGDVSIAPDAHITGGVLLGRNCWVASGARIIGPTVLADGTMVCRNARVENCVVWAGAAIGSHATLTRSLVTECFTVGPGAVLDRCVGVEGSLTLTLPLETGTHTVHHGPCATASAAW